MMRPLTEDQINFFKKNGFLILSSPLDKDVVTAWQQDFTGYFGEDITLPKDYARGYKLRSVDQFAFQPQHALSKNAGFLAIIDQLGAGTFKGGKEQLIIRQPEVVKKWVVPRLAHIDLTPPHVRWRFMLGYTAYGAATAKNGGCFVFWPGSHQLIWNYLSQHPQHYYENSTASLDSLQHIYQELCDFEPVQFEAEPGTVLLWHSFLLHNGSMNASKQPRIGIFGRFGQSMDDQEPRETFGNIWERWAI